MPEINSPFQEWRIFALSRVLLDRLRFHSLILIFVKRLCIRGGGALALGVSTIT
jgi:hypothetical protein